jgi:hypothetical protein
MLVTVLLCVCFYCVSDSAYCKSGRAHSVSDYIYFTSGSVYFGDKPTVFVL